MLTTILVLLAVFGVSFLVISGLYWVICWCFCFVFSWKYALGFWIILCILEGIFKKGEK